MPPAASVSKLGVRASPLFDPGTAFKYSNTNFCLLGLLIEKVTGQPFAAAIRDEVSAQRDARSRRTAKSLEAKLGARLRLTKRDTALTLLSLTDPALFTAFAAAGRSPVNYERWLGDVLVRTLID